MATSILVIGNSGTGKSTSIRTLDPKQTFIFNVNKKPLPFKGWKSKYSEHHKDANPDGNMKTTDNPEIIIKYIEYINLKRPEIKYIILEDAGYIMQNEFIRKAFDKGYEKFSSIGYNFSSVIQAAMNLPMDKFFICFMHSELDSDEQGNSILRAKSVGKLINQYLNIEGLFTHVYFTKVKRDGDIVEYVFDTKNTGFNTAKSPDGVFDSVEVPNDLLYVTEQIEKYDK